LGHFFSTFTGKIETYSVKPKQSKTDEKAKNEELDKNQMPEWNVEEKLLYNSGRFNVKLLGQTPIKFLISLSIKMNL